MAKFITSLPGVGGATAAILNKHGFRVVEDIANASPEALSAVPGFRASRAAKIIAAARAILAEEQAGKTPEVKKPPRARPVAPAAESKAEMAEATAPKVKAPKSPKPPKVEAPVVAEVKEKPAKVDFGIGMKGHDDEGRVVTCTFKDVVVVCVYTPNSGEGMKRLGYRTEWDTAFRNYVNGLAKGKVPVIVTGDLNVAHQPIDIARPKENYNKTSGYTQQEIDGIGALLASGWVDTFRHFHPETVKYSWWSQRLGARAKNVGWRLDYVLVSKGFEKKVRAAFILDEVMGSDHCPVGIEW